MKQLVSRLLVNNAFGRVVAAACGQRIPSLRFGGPRIDVGAVPIAPRNAARILLGLYETAEIGFIQSGLRSDLDVVELGASIGVVSCYLARELKPGRKLICVEAHPELVEAIRRNLEANAPEVEAHVVHAAIGYDGPTVRFLEGETNLGGRTGGRTETAGKTYEVPTTTLSALIERYELDQYALVSDIEGAEHQILACDARALRSCQQWIAELHTAEEGGDPSDVDALFERVQKELGFQLRGRRGDVGMFVRESPS